MPVVEPAADLGVLALVVLPDDHHVDLGGRAVGERRAHAPQEPDGPEIDVLAEGPADRDEEPPERDVVGHAGGADRAEEDRVAGPELLEAVLGHHPPGLREALAAPVELGPRELEPEPPRRRLENALALGHDLLADPVAGNHRDAMAHGPPFTNWRRRKAARDGRHRTVTGRGYPAHRPVN